jgi:hypothetical protein
MAKHKSIPLDMLGNELKVGDIVLKVSSQNSSVKRQIAIITELNENNPYECKLQYFDVDEINNPKNPDCLPWVLNTSKITSNPKIELNKNGRPKGRWNGVGKLIKLYTLKDKWLGLLS